MNKIFKCPHCGKSNEETKFTMIVMYSCDVDFQNDGEIYVGDIEYNIGLPGFLNQYCCSECSTEFDDFIIEDYKEVNK